MAHFDGLGFRYETAVDLYPEGGDKSDDDLAPCRDMLVRIDDITQNNIGVVSAACKSQLQTDARTRRFFTSDLTFIAESHAVEDGAACGQDPDLECMVEVYECSREYKQRQMTEAAWNCAVHFPVLDLARKLTPYSSSVRVVNM